MKQRSSVDRSLIVIIGRDFGFPNGYGATARIVSLARGFIANGAPVQVLCTRSTESTVGNAMNRDKLGEWMGIPFRYTCGDPVRNTSFFRRRMAEVLGISGAITHLIRHRKQLACIYYYTPQCLFFVFLIKCVSLFLSVPLVGEYTELPFVYQKKTVFYRWCDFLLRRLLCPQLDGLVVISTYLEETFRPYLRRRSPVLRVPIFVYPEEEKTNLKELLSTQKKKTEPVLMYSGNLEHKGELEDLIEAISILAHSGRSCRLLIVGGSSSVLRMELLKNLADSVPSNAIVDFTGSIIRTEIPDMLAQADVLVLPRRLGLFSRAGFPTKLAEYLMTGKPVIVSKVGDIPIYLRDGDNAYLIEPDNVSLLADKLGFVLDNFEDTTAVGLRGRQTALKYFNAVTESGRILGMINKLLNHQNDTVKDSI